VNMNELLVNQNMPSDEEKEYVRLLAEGKSYKDISRQFEINTNTFAYRMTSLRERYNCENSGALIAFFLRHKLIE
jgi:DNA-binding CsgD family transcriptional regulator